MKIHADPTTAAAPRKATVYLTDSDLALPKQVRIRSSVDFNRCYHCGCCTNGCPFLAAMDVAPNAVIRLVQLGLTQEVLTCATIWACVGCNTCSFHCPMGIDIPALMDTLRQMAIERGIVIAEPDILDFHQQVIDSIERYGRTHKLEIMLRYKAQKRRWFEDWEVGLKMLSKRKLDLTPSRLNHMQELRRLFAASRKEWPHGK